MVPKCQAALLHSTEINLQNWNTTLTPLTKCYTAVFLIYSTHSADVHFDDRNERAP